jgi:hypothetical protein
VPIFDYAELHVELARVPRRREPSPQRYEHVSFSLLYLNLNHVARADRSNDVLLQ